MTRTADQDQLMLKIKSAESWIRDEEDSLRRMKRRHADERRDGEEYLAKARTALARNQSAYNEAADEPWCNHDAVVSGICECGVRVS